MSSERRRVGSGSRYEGLFGYSRAVRSGPLVSVSGTAAIEPDGSVTRGGAGAQAERCLEITAEALEQLGASLEDVIRTRIYLVDIEDWPAVGAVHARRFGAIRPAATLVQVSRLIDPAMLVEIETDAWIPSGR